MNFKIVKLVSLLTLAGVSIAAVAGPGQPIGGIVVKGAEVQLRNGRACKHSRIDSALTIRSSRDRFAASAVHGNIGFCQGRKAVRLNSGVSATSCSFFAVELRNVCLACSSVHKPGHMATDSVQPRTAALRLCTEFT